MAGRLCRFLLVFVPILARATTIVSIGPNSTESLKKPLSALTDAPLFQYGSVSWVQSATYTNITISASLSITNGGHGTGIAYLMNAVGPGTTAANEVAAPVLIEAGEEADRILFSGLTLGPGTYYLVIVSDGSLRWETANHPLYRSATGAWLGFGGTEGSGVGYGPASSYELVPADFVFSVTGDQGVPERGTMGLVGAGLVLVAGGHMRVKANKNGGFASRNGTG